MIDMARLWTGTINACGRVYEEFIRAVDRGEVSIDVDAETARAATGEFHAIAEDTAALKRKIDRARAGRTLAFVKALKRDR